MIVLRCGPWLARLGQTSRCNVLHESTGSRQLRQEFDSFAFDFASLEVGIDRLRHSQAEAKPCLPLRECLLPHVQVSQDSASSRSQERVKCDFVLTCRTCFVMSQESQQVWLRLDWFSRLCRQSQKALPQDPSF